MDASTRVDVDMRVPEWPDGEAGTYLECLEKQLNHLQCTARIVAGLLAIVAVLLGFQTLGNIESYTQSQVEDDGLDNAVPGSNTDRLSRAAAFLTSFPAFRAPLFRSVRPHVEDAVAAKVGRRTAQQFDAQVARRDSLASRQALIPRGTIIAWVPGGPNEEIPEGWVLCDGSNGTPNLNGRYLVGTLRRASIGLIIGDSTHGHSVAGRTGVGSGFVGTGAGIEAVSNFLSASSHTHQFQLRTSRATHLPPSTRVFFLMKV